MRFLLSLLAAASVGVALAEKHAVLIAGSNGYANYRHQADIAHAYKILVDGGVKPDNIIVMMYDDIARSLRNKFRGELYNRPDGSNGDAPPEVYSAVKDHIDYRGLHVSPKNFLKVLTGDKSAGGRVLTSGPEDDVFVYFADHGGVGILGFPTLAVLHQVLHADDLNAALKTMHEKNMYKRLVVYVEACESGSIFDGLLDASLGIYAVTAANAKESSWGWYCGQSTGNNTVKGKRMGVCLGDLFSIKWMENTDAVDETKVSLSEQFDHVKHATFKSHVQKFGNFSFTSSPLATFLGSEPTPSASVASVSDRVGVPEGTATVDSRDATLHYLRWQLSDRERPESGASDSDIEEARRELAAEEKSRERATRLFETVWRRVSGFGTEGMLERYMPPRRFDCHREVISSSNLAYTDFSLKYHRVVVNLCEMGFEAHNISKAFVTTTSAMA